MAVAQMFRHGDRATGNTHRPARHQLLCRRNCFYSRWRYRSSLRPKECALPASRQIPTRRDRTFAKTKAIGSARPTSSAAQMTMRRAMETRVFAGMDHFREPIQRGVGIAAAHGFDERGNSCRNAHRHRRHTRWPFFGCFVRRQPAVMRMTPSAVRRRRERRDFERIQNFARVAVGNSRKVAQSIFVGRNFQITEAAFFIRQRALQEANINLLPSGRAVQRSANAKRAAS